MHNTIFSFQANRLDIDIVETSFYEHKEIHGPPREDEEIHEEALYKSIDVASRIANKCYYFGTRIIGAGVSATLLLLS